MVLYPIRPFLLGLQSPAGDASLDARRGLKNDNAVTPLCWSPSQFGVLVVADACRCSEAEEEDGGSKR